MPSCTQRPCGVAGEHAIESVQAGFQAAGPAASNEDRGRHLWPHARGWAVKVAGVKFSADLHPLRTRDPCEKRLRTGHVGRPRSARPLICTVSAWGSATGTRCRAEGLDHAKSRGAATTVSRFSRGVGFSVRLVHLGPGLREQTHRRLGGEQVRRFEVGSRRLSSPQGGRKSQLLSDRAPRDSPPE